MVGAWVIILVAVTVGHRAFGGTYDDDFALPGSAAARGADLLKAHEAALLNLFSIGAAYGVIVAVFQWGWGGSLLGVSGKSLSSRMSR